MRAVSALDDFVPHLEAAHEAVFAAPHHPVTPDPSCLGCTNNAEGALASVFAAWERFLFELLVALLAGGQTFRHFEHHCLPRFPGHTLASARQEVLRTRISGGTVGLRPQPGNFLLLHAPAQVIAVSDFWIEGSPISATVLRHQAELERLVRIRHGLAHGTAHAVDGLRTALLYYEPLQIFRRVGDFLLYKPPAGGTTYLELFLERLFDISTSMSG